MTYTWILFDADSTLFDYNKSEAQALRSAFEASGHRFQPHYASVYREINQKLWDAYERGEISQARLRVKRFADLFEAVHLEIDPVAFSTTYLEHLAQGHFLMPGAEKVVKALYGKVGLMLITNGIDAVQRTRLAGSAIADFFPDIVTSEAVGAAKPDSRIFEVAFERMGNPSKETVLMVGDSLTSDIQGGNAFGIATCWFNPGQKPRSAEIAPRYEIRALNDLLTIIGVS